MDFISEIIKKAKSDIQTIVLPETEDERVLKAAAIIKKEKIADIILVGNEQKVLSFAKEIGANIDGIKIIDPLKSEFLDEFVDIYTAKREKKGMTKEKAREILTTKYIFFGAMLVDKGIAGGMVAGSVNPTATTLRSIFHCIGVEEGKNTVSSFFVMISPNKQYGENGLMFFADCAVVPNPTDIQLSEIAEATADNFTRFIGKKPRVAFLSFSTKGSADTEETQEVKRAVELLHERRSDIEADGEMQLDAAIVESVGKRKAPGSNVAGNANVLIFPDLNAGNIGYKLVQRLGNAEAIGPILQGAKKPVNDLSRGCDVEDIVNVVAITSIQVK